MQRHNRKRTYLARWTALIAITLAKLAHADQAAVAFDITRPWGGAIGQGVYGWQFTAQSEMQVLALGVYDNPGIYGGGFAGDGLMEPHIISLWDLSQPSSPLVSAVTPLGTAAPLLNGFRYVDVNASSTILHSHHVYVIGATYPTVVGPNKDWAAATYIDPNSLTVGQELTFGGYRSILDYSGQPVFPNTYSPGYLFAFGPNFTYTVVPEPKSSALCAIGVGVLWALRRTNYSRAQP